MRGLLDGLADALPVSLIPYLLFGGAALVTAFFFVMAFLLNRK